MERRVDPARRGGYSRACSIGAAADSRRAIRACLKLPRFRGVFDGFVDYGSVVAVSMIASYAIGER
jgi:hypothetical protein